MCVYCRFKSTTEKNKYRNLSAPQELRSGKTLQLTRPRSYGKFGVRGTTAAINTNQKSSKLPVTSLNTIKM
jgi:hypothetical protein